LKAELIDKILRIKDYYLINFREKRLSFNKELKLSLRARIQIAKLKRIEKRAYFELRFLRNEI